MQVGGAGSPLSSGLAGIQKGQEQVTQAAHQVASANTTRPVSSSQDLSKALMEEKQGQQQVEASAKVVETANQTLGTLVDLRV